MTDALLELGVKALAVSIALLAVINILPKLIAYVHSCLTEDL
jgi:hypothetical protein